MSGLDICENEFMTLTVKQQNLILFKNGIEIRNGSKDYRFHKKIQYSWLLILSIVMGLKRFITL